MALSQSVYLAAMGIQSWQLKQPNSPSAENLVVLCTIATDCTAQAGQLLDGMLYAMGLDRKSITLLECQLLDGSSPPQEEIDQWVLSLEKQIALVRPKVLLVFGGVVAQGLLDTQVSIEELRGKLHGYGAQAIPLIVTYHPAHLLLNPQDKKKAWQDLQMLRKNCHPRESGDPFSINPKQMKPL